VALNNPNYPIDLDEQYLIDNAPIGDCEIGFWVQPILDFIKENGVPDEINGKRYFIKNYINLNPWFHTREEICLSSAKYGGLVSGYRIKDKHGMSLIGCDGLTFIFKNSTTEQPIIRVSPIDHRDLSNDTYALVVDI
jgi:hypothetical protein